MPSFFCMMQQSFQHTDGKAHSPNVTGPCIFRKAYLKERCFSLDFSLASVNEEEGRRRSTMVNQNIRPSMWWKSSPSTGVIMITMGYIAIRIPETEPFSREGAALAPALKWLQYMTVI